MANLAGITYDVQVRDGGRWMTVDVHNSKKASILKAEDLSNSARYSGVQVIAESEYIGSQVIFERTMSEPDPKPVTLISIKKAPVCDKMVEYYQLSSRKIISRVMRNLLDQSSVTVLELLFDRSELKMFERRGAMHAQLIQQIAATQARVLEIKASERADILFRMFTQITDKALDFVDDDEGLKALKNNGFNALFDCAKSLPDDEIRYYFTRNAMAKYLSEGGGWDAKINLIISAAVGNLSHESVEAVDEILSEILEGPAAIIELLGGQSDAAVANHAMIQLCEGRYPVPKNPITSIVEFNQLMARINLPLTSTSLYHQVARYLAGTKTLTREGPASDREAFIGIVRALIDGTGLKGGVKICRGVTKRARLVFAKDDEDISLIDAISKICGMLPNRAGRIGYLLELLQSDVGKRHGDVVLTALERIVTQINSLSMLMPEGSSDVELKQAIEGLKLKVNTEGLPEEWRKVLSDTFNTLMAKPQIVEKTSETFTLRNEGRTKMVAKAPHKKKMEKGQILFEEGDHGSEAYLIMSGFVEIYRKLGNREEVIARLGRGEIIGEMSLIDNQPRIASARVLERGQVSIIDQANFISRLDKLGESDRVLRRVVDVLVNRVRGEGGTQV